MLIKGATVRRVLALLMISMLSLAALEAGVRWTLPEFHPAHQMHLFVPEGEAVQLGEPGAVGRQRKNTGDYDVTVRFNSMGLRERRDYADASPETVLVVGDSFAFGWGVEVEQRFSNRLEERLGAGVFNAAAPGATLDGVRYLRELARNAGAQSQTLVITLTMENDLAATGASVAAASNRLLGGARRWLTDHSALYRAATAAVHRTPTLRRAFVAMGLIRPNLAAVPNPHRDEVDVAATAAGLHQVCDASRCLVLVIPSRALWLAETAADAEILHDAVVNGLRAADLELIDLDPVMRAVAQPLSLHFANDGHWNASGHELAAEALYEALSPRP